MIIVDIDKNLILQQSLYNYRRLIIDSPDYDPTNEESKQTLNNIEELLRLLQI